MASHSRKKKLLQNHSGVPASAQKNKKSRELSINIVALARRSNFHKKDSTQAIYLVNVFSDQYCRSCDFKLSR